MTPQAQDIHDRTHARRDAMRQRLVEWCSINSHAHNLGGLRWLAAAVAQDLAGMGASVELIDLPARQIVDDQGQIRTAPLGRVVVARRREDAPVRVLLNIHLDTVYEPDDAFQSVAAIDEDTLRGPGVADAKGGLVVLLEALRAFEQAPDPRVGWVAVINPDEEIGSPGSAPLLRLTARRCTHGMVFEPALPDGSLVATRKGSAQLTLVVRGRAAHSGRNFDQGRSAVLAAAELLQRLDALHRDLPGVIVNCGRIVGGSAPNMVPDRCALRFAIRVETLEERSAVDQTLQALLEEFNARDGLAVERHGQFHADPLVMTEARRTLYDAATACAADLGLTLGAGATGGASDANKLAAVGLPVIDGLGVLGGDLHSPREFVRLRSLPERAALAALLLHRLAAGA